MQNWNGRKFLRTPVSCTHVHSSKKIFCHIFRMFGRIECDEKSYYIFLNALSFYWTTLRLHPEHDSVRTMDSCGAAGEVYMTPSLVKLIPSSNTVYM